MPYTRRDNVLPTAVAPARDNGPVPGRVATKIFISYRRGDTAGFVHRLYEDLARRYGRESVFLDLDDIEPGQAFPERIRAAAAAARVFLVVIGKSWSSVVDAAGRRRIEDPDDWVVAEVGAALSSGGDVLPVLVEGARMPEAGELPPAIQGLLAKQAVEITPQRWEEDSRRLDKAIDGFLLGRRRRPPLRWGLAAAALAAAIAMLAWAVDLTAVPGLRWSHRLLERGLALQAPAALGGEAVWLVEVEDAGLGLDARRGLYADVLDTLAGAGTRVVTLDAFFDWASGGGESDADRRFAASIAAAAQAGSAVVLATAGLPRPEEAEPGRPRLRSPVPAWLQGAVGDRWGHVCLAVTPSDGGPFARLEVARLQHDPAGPGRSGAIWPTLALRAVMEYRQTPKAAYSFADEAIHLCAPSESSSAPSSEACGPQMALRRRIPVERFAQPRASQGNECLGEGADLLMVTLHLLRPDALQRRTRSAAARDALAQARQELVVVGSAREGPQPELGDLVGYQVQAQTIADLLGDRTVRPAGLLATLLPVAAAGLVGGLWRRRGRRPLAISDAATPYRHWLASAADAAVATLAVSGLAYLAALVVFHREHVVLAVPYVTAASAAAYLLLALAERRRLS